MATIYKRGKHRTWYISYFFNGTRRFKSLKTRDEKLARLMKKELEVKLARKSHAESEKQSIKSCLSEYLETKNHRKEGSSYNEECTINRFIESISKSSIDSITSADIISYMRDFSEKAPQTYNNVLAVLRRFFKFALLKNYILKNPTELISHKRVPQRQVKFFTDDEYSKIEKVALGHPLFPMIVTARYTGLRLQELTNLEWQDFDWSRRVLHVSNKKSHTTKNYRNRIVPICKELHDKLLSFVKAEGLCFPVPSGITKGKRYSIQGPKRTIQKIFSNAGVATEKGKAWHKLRKTFATKLKETGVSIAKISDWLGHASIKVTELYLGCSSSYDDDIEKLSMRSNALIKGKKNTRLTTVGDNTLNPKRGKLGMLVVKRKSVDVSLKP